MTLVPSSSLMPAPPSSFLPTDTSSGNGLPSTRNATVSGSPASTTTSFFPPAAKTFGAIALGLASIFSLSMLHDPGPAAFSALTLTA